MATETERKKAASPALHSAEDLDTQVRTTTTRQWLAVVAVIVVIGVIFAWSFLATIPQLTTTSGVITTMQPPVQVNASATGTVVKLGTGPGLSIKAGDPVAEIMSGANKSVVRSPSAGQVALASVVLGSAVTEGSPLVTITPDPTGQDLLVQSYVSQEQAVSFAVGQVLPVTLSRGGYTMQGVVVSVSNTPSTEAEMAEVLRDPDVASSAYDAANGSPISVLLNLGTQPTWTTSPPDFSPGIGTAVTITQTVNSQRPIQMLFG